MRHAISEADPAPLEVNQDHADADYRERRHAEFVAWARDRMATLYGGDFGMLLCDLISAIDRPKTGGKPLNFERPFRDFAGEFGWPSTLRALAQALEAEKGAAA